MDVVPPYKGELLTDFAVDNTEDPRLGAFSCNSGVIGFKFPFNLFCGTYGLSFSC